MRIDGAAGAFSGDGAWWYKTEREAGESPMVVIEGDRTGVVGSKNAGGLGVKTGETDGEGAPTMVVVLSLSSQAISAGWRKDDRRRSTPSDSRRSPAATVKKRSSPPATQEEGRR